MTKRRLIVVVFALVGAVVGALVGILVTPHSTRFEVSANVVLVPPPQLSSGEASSFWEVLTGGQVSRTAAIIFQDARWLPAAAAAAGVAPHELSLTAYALPETTMLTVTVQASSRPAADSALNSVLTAATPEVSSVLSPYFVKVLWPQKGHLVTGPGKKQFAVAGALGGLLVCGGVGWLFVRRRSGAAVRDTDGPDLLDKEPSSR
ncbi:MAG: hypothetical protein AB7G47_12810 [Mycolicibacterium sp.]|uniref:hypothetical protein n=1 Tax=Mycolicibacterium sp. TaxID=2320850 RepID=UPI003D122603